MKTHELVGHLAEFKVDKANPAEPPRLVKLKPNPQPCEDCDLVCERKIEHSLRLTPIKHWRTKCTGCGKWRNPETGEFDCTPQDLNGIYRLIDSQLQGRRKYERK